jgi:hypothetical protein
MPCLERHADLAVRFEAADPRAVPGARVDDDERSARHVDFDPRRRDDANQAVIHRPLELAAVDDELRLVFEHIGNRLLQVFAIGVAALAHHVPEQGTPPSGIDHVFHRRGERAEGRRGRGCRLILIVAQGGPSARCAEFHQCFHPSYSAS